MRYQFTGEMPLILGEFSHGRNAVVTRANPDADADAEGSTVVLLPGDIVDLGIPLDSPDFTHPLLEPLDDLPKSPWAALGKPELLVAAGDRGLNVTSRASKAELVTALDAYDGTQPSSEPPVELPPFEIGTLVRLNEQGRALIPGTDPGDVGEVIGLPTGIPLIRWASQPEESPAPLSAEYLELATDTTDPAPAVSTASE